MTESEQELHDVRAFNPPRESDDPDAIEAGAELDELPFDLPRD